MEEKRELALIELEEAKAKITEEEMLRKDATEKLAVEEKKLAVEEKKLADSKYTLDLMRR